MKKQINEESPGTLALTEPHPGARIALDFIRTFTLPELFLHQEALASCAIEGNRTAEICLETLRRLLYKEPVSDRYLMGLAWYLWSVRG